MFSGSPHTTPNSRDFYKAIMMSNMSEFNRLLPLVDINSPGRCNNHFLHETTNLGNTEMTKAIVSHPHFKPCDTLRSGPVGSVFHHIHIRNMDALEATLPKLSYQLSARNNKNHTPLQETFSKFPLERNIVRWLLKVGADPAELFEFEYVTKLVHKHLPTQLDFMVEQDLHKVVYQDTVNKVNTLLHCAVDTDNLEAVRSLLHAGAPVVIDDFTYGNGASNHVNMRNANICNYAIERIHVQQKEQPKPDQNMTSDPVGSTLSGNNSIDIALALIDASPVAPSFGVLVKLYARFFWTAGIGLEGEEAEKVINGAYDDIGDDLRNSLVRVFAASFSISQPVAEGEVEESKLRFQLEEPTFNFLLNLYQMSSLMEIVSNFVRKELMREHNNVVEALENKSVQDILNSQGAGYDVKLREVQERYIKVFRQHMTE